jgi:uncharacterized protein (DUF1800 family)
MELFTCGRVGPEGKPNYTEEDVKAGARAFTGWNIRDKQFWFNPNQHDDDIKTFMGRTGNFDGDDIIEILVSLSATGHFLCRKLFRYFAYDDPEPAVLDALVKTYFVSGYSVKAIVSQILRSDAFWSARARLAIIKPPVQYVIGTIRMANMAGVMAPAPQQFDDDYNQMQMGAAPTRPSQRRAGTLGRLAFLANSMRSMGQNLLAPPSVKGWDGGAMWINTDTLQARERFANSFSQLPALSLDMATDGTLKTEDMVDLLLRQFGPIELSDSTRQAMIDYAQAEAAPRQRARGLLSLLMSTPEYQVC